MLAPLSETLGAIGRLDRWNELMKALDEYEEHREIDAFLKIFSYCLTY
jgi:hypothetical protein